MPVKNLRIQDTKIGYVYTFTLIQMSDYLHEKFINDSFIVGQSVSYFLSQVKYNISFLNFVHKITLF